MKFLSSSEKDTFAFAKNFSNKLIGGEIIALVGDLGAGKTIFTKGLAKGLGIKKNIASPTFILMKIYNVNQNNNIKFLAHLDAYRIKNADSLLAIGLKDYLGKSDTVTVIEWADKIKKILPKKAKFIKILHQNNNLRKISL
jgi:tRNA threonylcarbamoyladenosine biosynthesis protein TsaE